MTSQSAYRVMIIDSSGYVFEVILKRHKTADVTSKRNTFISSVKYVCPI